MISFPSLDQIKNRTRSDLSQTTELDATIRRSFLRSLADALASRSFDLNKTIQQLVGQLFPQTASGVFLRRWGDYQGLPPLEATGSSGLATLAGEVGLFVFPGTQFTSGDVILSSVGGVIVSNITVTITSLTRIGTTVTAVTTGNHDLATGITTTIFGAVETEYNGDFVVTAIDLTSFTYEISGTPSTPATTLTDLLTTFDGAIVSLVSDGFGVSQNLDSGAKIDTSFTTLSITVAVGPDGITGGTDAEIDEDYSARILDARAKPTSLFNVGQITLEAKKVNGVTRVFVKEATPLAGQVEVYFLRDNDDPINPDANEILDVKTQLLTIKPAFMADADLFVLAPTLVSTAFTFSAILPDTSSMRDAISASLDAFFAEDVDFEVAVTEDAYRAAIQSSIDSSGNSLESFTLSTPTTDISVSVGEIAALGTVTFT